MSFSIVKYEKRHEASVSAFNARMAAAGSDWEFYDQAQPTWLGEAVGEPRREFFLAVENDDDVRGAYCLKFQRFRSSVGSIFAASIQGPVSEGLVDQRYSSVALHLIRDMQAREPALFAWGVSDRLSGLLSRLKWKSYATPLCLRVVDPSRFLSENRFLSGVPKFQRIARLLQALSLSRFAFSTIQLAAQVIAGGAPKASSAILEPRFAAWADTVWEASRGAYSFIAERDSVTMNRLLPENDWPEADILRIEHEGMTVGWAAARCSSLSDDARFGNLRVGSVVDALAVPGWEASVLQAATRHLEARGAEAIIANFSSGVWVKGFRRCGFLISPGRRILVVSPQLVSDVGADVVSTDMHLTPLDGDGPLGL